MPIRVAAVAAQPVGGIGRARGKGIGLQRVQAPPEYVRAGFSSAEMLYGFTWCRSSAVEAPQGVTVPSASTIPSIVNGS